MKLLKFYTDQSSNFETFDTAVNLAKNKIHMLIEDIDIDKRPDLAEKYNIPVVPTLMLVDDSDSECGRISGNITVHDVLQLAGATH